MNIGLDMMGGDFAPLEAVKGVAEFLAADPDQVHLTLIGDETQIKTHIAVHNIPADKYTIVHTTKLPEQRRKSRPPPVTFKAIINDLFFDAEEPLQSKSIPIQPQSADHALPFTGHQTYMSVFFTGIHIGNMHLDNR